MPNAIWHLPIDIFWQLPNCGVMKQNAVISLIEQIVEETGLAASTICQRAIKDPHLLDRLKKRDEQDSVRVQKLQAFRASVSAKPFATSKTNNSVIQ